MGFWPRGALARMAALGLFYCAIAFLCLSVTRFGASVESIWLSNALLTAALVVSTPRLWPGLVAAAAAGHVLAHVFAGDRLDFAFAFLIGDMAEALICASLFKLRPSALAFEDWRGVTYFFVICVGSAAISTPIAAATTWAIADPLSGYDLLIWFAVDTLGLIVFLPIFHGFGEQHWRRIRERPLWLALAIVIVVLVAVVGAWTQNPIARLVMLPIFVVIAFQFSVAGVVMGLSALLFTWTTFAVVGEPIDGWPYDDLRTYLLLAQAYMAAVAVTVVPIAVILEERERMSLQLADAAKAEAAKIEAQKANAFKSRLIAMASHDLRQPLFAAQTYISILEERLADPKLKDICGSAGQALDSMNNIMESLLDVTRLDAGIIAPRLKDFNVAEMLERIAASNRPQAATKGVEVIVRCPHCIVRSDSNLLERVVDNFVSNAVRYTERGSVTLWCEPNGAQTMIGVTDTGIGIAPEALPTIFSDYVQLNNPEHDQSKGLGLGLTIAQRMADLLGHRIDVRSKVGEGSTFSVEVPVSAEVRNGAPILV